MSFSVGVRPSADSTEYNYDGYYSALASEYLIDDFAAVVKGSEFANAVSARLTDEGITIAPGVIQGSTQTGTLHRILQMTLYGGDPDQLQLIADATTATLEQDADQFMPRLLADQGAVYLIDRGGVSEIRPGLRQRLDLPLRLALAFVAGIGLIFLLEYLDNRIRGRADLEAMGIAVLGEVPGK